MKRKTVVLLWGGRERTAFRPALGRPLGAYALEAACGLGPDAVLVLPGRGAAAGDDWEGLIRGVATPVPVFLLEAGRPAPAPRREGALAALVTARGVLEKYPDCDVLTVPADMPLVRTRTLKALLRAHAARRMALTFLSAGAGGLTGVCAVRSADAFPHLEGPAAVRGGRGFEALALRLTRAGGKVGFHDCPDPGEALTAGDASSAGQAAAVLRARKNEALARRGVVLLDPGSAWIDWQAAIGPGTVVHPFVVIEGATRVGAEGRIHPHVHIVGSTLGARVKVLASTVMDGAVLEDDVQVGPFSRLRPGTRVRAGARVGNFVEMKNTVFGRRSKAMHLSYLGDSAVGEDVNIGAGTITCNYDGVSKNPTTVGAGAFIGSGTELVAPVKVGRGAYVAAGSTITKDVSAGALALARAKQVEKPGWVLERVRGRKKARGSGKP